MAEQAVAAMAAEHGFLTVLAEKLTGEEAFIVIFLICIAATMGGFAWLRRKETEEARLRNEARDMEQRHQDKEIEEARGEIKEVRRQLDDFATKAELAEVKSELREMGRGIAEIHKEMAAKSDIRELFGKIDRLRESHDRFKETIYTGRINKEK